MKSMEQLFNGRGDEDEDEDDAEVDVELDHGHRDCGKAATRTICRRHVILRWKDSKFLQEKNLYCSGFRQRSWPCGRLLQSGFNMPHKIKKQQHHPPAAKPKGGTVRGPSATTRRPAGHANPQPSLQATVVRSEEEPRPRFVPNQVCNGLPIFKFWPATREDMDREAVTVAEQKRAREEDTERTFSGMRVSKNRGKAKKGKGGTRMLFKTDKKGVNLVSALLHAHGFARTGSSKADVIWSFNRLQPSFHKSLDKGQKINQFPKSMEITRKSALSQNVASMQQQFRGDHFNFIPKSFILPRDASSFKDHFSKHPGTPWIVKPAGGACGRNIFISDNVQEILNAGMSGTYLVDQYIANPLLIGGLKFDLRIYVGVTSFYPLRVYVFEDGLARFATQPYSTDPESFRQAYIHLTNYSLNKYSENFVANESEEHEDVGTKQSISALTKKLIAMGIDCDTLWDNIDDVIIKTLLCIEPKVKQECDLSVGSNRSCFQLFGFDILVDDCLKPWLLEVNFTPSLAVDAPIDMRIKGKMLADLFTLAGIQPRRSAKGSKAKKKSASNSGPIRGRGAVQPPRETERQVRRAGLDGNLTSVERIVAARTADENARAGGFRRIYPSVNGFMYSQFMEKDRVLNFAITNFLFKQHQEAEQDAHVDAGALGVMQARLQKQRESARSAQESSRVAARNISSSQSRRSHGSQGTRGSQRSRRTRGVQEAQSRADAPDELEVGENQVVVDSSNDDDDEEEGADGEALEGDYDLPSDTHEYEAEQYQQMDSDVILNEHNGEELEQLDRDAIDPGDETGDYTAEYESEEEYFEDDGEEDEAASGEDFSTGTPDEGSALDYM